MSSRSISLDEFITKYQFWGNWEVSYTDRTHLPHGKYVKLGDIAIDYDEPMARDYPVLPFTFQPSTDEQIGEQIKSHFPKVKDVRQQADRARRIIRDQLAESLVRTGLLRPTLWLMQDHTIQMGFREVLNKLGKYPYLIFVVDTSAMRRGAVSFLCKALPQVSMWTVVPVFVMTEVQRQVADLNDTWRKIAEKRAELHPGKCDILEKRPQVACISREMNYIQRWRPVELLATLPELLSRSNTDRLIIESVKNLKRERGLHQGVYLLTGDKDMASLAVLENVNSLHIGVPPLLSGVCSLRYDSQNRTFLLSPIHYLLWDLAQVFSTIQVRSPVLDRQYELIYYSEARGGFFAYDVMGIQER